MSNITELISALCSCYRSTVRYFPCDFLIQRVTMSRESQKLLCDRNSRGLTVGRYNMALEKHVQQVYSYLKVTQVHRKWRCSLLERARIEVTSLTFQGHVTLSATWPFYSSQVISCLWSFGTKPLFL